LTHRHLVEHVADLNRQQVEHRTRGDPLQTLDADVGDRERVSPRRLGCEQAANQSRDERASPEDPPNH
jgi:hypothetical protein